MTRSAASSPPAGHRSLRDVVEREAPVAASRATSIMVAVARELERHELAGVDAGDIRSDLVVLSGDGSVEIAPGAGRPMAPDAAGDELVEPGSSAGASVGRLLFELLTGRPPLGREDAFEPVVVAALSPDLCALVARSCSDAPGQWPSAGTWRAALESTAGGLAPPLPPRESAALRRRRLLVAVGVVALAVATVAVLLLAPGWWDSATEEGHAAARAVQPERTSS